MTAKELESSIPMSLLSFNKSVDRGSYEKLSIRDSARSLKKYGSTSTKNATKNESYMKHYVSNSDTLQGIALKYNVTIEQIRRANKLWASDSLFLREFLLIPQSEADVNNLPSPSETQSTSSQSSLTSPSTENLNQNNRISVASVSTRSGSFDEENISDFLSKIDASIANTKEVVKKVASSSEYGTDLPPDQRRKPQSRLKQQYQQQQQQNNNLDPNVEHRLSNQTVAPLNTVVTVQQGEIVSAKNEVSHTPLVHTTKPTHTYTWPQKRKLDPARTLWHHWKLRGGSYRITYDKF